MKRIASTPGRRPPLDSSHWEGHSGVVAHKSDQEVWPNLVQASRPEIQDDCTTKVMSPSIKKIPPRVSAAALRSGFLLFDHLIS
jgi:hypothetical protein